MGGRARGRGDDCPRVQELPSQGQYAPVAVPMFHSRLVPIPTSSHCPASSLLILCEKSRPVVSRGAVVDGGGDPEEEVG